jgi:hypothetical protein
MGIFAGTNEVTEIWAGASEIKEVYAGTQLVWTKGDNVIYNSAFPHADSGTWQFTGNQSSLNPQNQFTYSIGVNNGSISTVIGEGVNWDGDGDGGHEVETLEPQGPPLTTGTSYVLTIDFGNKYHVTEAVEIKILSNTGSTLAQWSDQPTNNNILTLPFSVGVNEPTRSQIYIKSATLIFNQRVLPGEGLINSVTIVEN